MIVAELNLYPVKSLRGIPLDEATVLSYGFEHDRRWMLVDSNSRMITQRECPRLATLAPALEPNGLRIRAADLDDIRVAFEPAASGGEELTVDVFGHVYVGAVAPDAVNTALSEAIGISCRLLSMRSDVFRTKSDVAFHDASPILVLAESSLDDLNRRLAEPLPMNRFRPNIVISGAGAFEEDAWQRIAIADVVFRAVKQCERCAIPTVDQSLGKFRGPEPLKTLATFRRKGQNVAFGTYYRPESVGAKIRRGDEVRVVERAAVGAATASS